MVNVPHPAIGSRASREHLPPLSLLAIAGPLIEGQVVEFAVDQADLVGRIGTW
jgi:hypothetical protein